MKIIREPGVFVVGRQSIDDVQLDRFLAEHDVDSWQTDTDVAGQKLSEVAGRVCYMSFAKPRPPLFARAMTEAMDSELARILQSVPPNTWVIFVGDNGTANEATDGGTPPSHSKGTVYEGGVNVPLIITGPGVVPGECRALVNTTDLFATIADLAGVPSSAEDSVSLLPYLSDPKLPSLREWVFAESFGKENYQRAIRGARYKLIRRYDGVAVSESFYDLQEDPSEQTDLLLGTLSPEEEDAYLLLRCRIPPGAEVETRCPQPQNSTGAPALLEAMGSSELDLNAFRLEAASLPPSAPVMFLAGMGTMPIRDLFTGGAFCLGGAEVGHFGSPTQADADGHASVVVDLVHLPFDPPLAVMPGETWGFQVWYRDGGARFSNAVSVTFE